MVCGWLGDRLKWRMPVIAASQAILVVSYSLQLAFAGSVGDNIAVSYFAVFLATIGIYPIPPGVSAWTLNNLAGPLKRSWALP